MSVKGEVATGTTF